MRTGISQWDSEVYNVLGDSFDAKNVALLSICMVAFAAYLVLLVCALKNHHPFTSSSIARSLILFHYSNYLLSSFIGFICFLFIFLRLPVMFQKSGNEFTPKMQSTPMAPMPSSPEEIAAPVVEGDDEVRNVGDSL